MGYPVHGRAVRLLAVILLAAAAPAFGQGANPPMPAWAPDPFPPWLVQNSPDSRARLPLVPGTEPAASRTHTATGLLIGGLVGAAATTLFLVSFCGDPDTACGTDEVGRAVVIIAVPCAAVGALIGSLIRTGH